MGTDPLTKILRTFLGPSTDMGVARFVCGDRASGRNACWCCLDSFSLLSTGMSKIRKTLSTKSTPRSFEMISLLRFCFTLKFSSFVLLTFLTDLLWHWIVYNVLCAVKKLLTPSRRIDWVDSKTPYDTRCYFNVHSKADISQLNLPHGNYN